MRRLHALAGLLGLALVTFMAITGFVLSLQPVLETVGAARSASPPSVAAIAARVNDAVPGLERLVRLASGQLVAYGREGASRSAEIVDPSSGAVVGAYAPSPVFSFISELHRSLFLGSAGHGIAGIGALAILVLSVSGIGLLVRKMGGWRQLLATPRGSGSQRLHTNLARAAILALLLTASTGIYMSAAYFELLPSSGAEFSFAPSGSGGTPAPIASLDGLAGISLTDLRELVFPAADDARDVFTLTTSSGQGYVDQSTGALLSFTPSSVWQQAYELIYMLHTGQGAAVLAVLLGLGALAAPVLALTGSAIWWLRRRSMPRVAHNASWRESDTVILVGSESGSTWGFAASLHEALVACGHRVHLAGMNELRRSYPGAARLLVLTATYGDGTAPASARQFLARLGSFSSRPAFAVLGFGDQSFPQFCGYAARVEAALAERGLEPLLPVYGIDRQSPADFAAWGNILGERLGLALALSHVPPRPRTSQLVLEERTLFGVEVQAPVAILRFAMPDHPQGWLGRRRLPRFEAGDLVGILPPGSDVPRYYSIASASSDGVLEICVRKQTSGICSEFLHALLPGETVEAFVRPNPDFRPNRSRRPLILVGAGAGIAPLAGFVRHNRYRAVHLFFGARDPGSDFLYRDEMEQALAEGRLASLTTAFSRVLGGAYVQDRLLEEGARVRELVERGAQIMVCGGREMASGVQEAMDACLAPLGLSVAILKRKGLYLEDAY
ncbi:MAG TPA: PepSY domain-containing protein [Devosia sp.]|jgi:sulfite reductase (NADPH) flavoprotein alpha-component|uniref:PepSY domain-containing protein n=1 Tax=Devosia sp. TaxID=1871048 RepID=UPI002DDD3227|nr:PepSY domain-containing protein [Devosia sp.]HEV2516140.1 PepSY domain-containing protein [Devosia sp.]